MLSRQRFRCGSAFFCGWVWIIRHGRRRADIRTQNLVGHSKCLHSSGSRVGRASFVSPKPRQLDARRAALYSAERMAFASFCSRICCAFMQLLAQRDQRFSHARLSVSLDLLPSPIVLLSGETPLRPQLFTASSDGNRSPPRVAQSKLGLPSRGGQYARQSVCAAYHEAGAEAKRRRRCELPTLLVWMTTNGVVGAQFRVARHGRILSMAEPCSRSCSVSRQLNYQPAGIVV